MCFEGLWELTCRYLAICMGVKLWSSVYCPLLRKSAMVTFITAPGLCELLKRRTAKRYRSHWMSISLPDTASCTSPSINSIHVVEVLCQFWYSADVSQTFREVLLSSHLLAHSTLSQWWLPFCKSLIRHLEVLLTLIIQFSFHKWKLNAISYSFYFFNCPLTPIPSF